MTIHTSLPQSLTEPEESHWNDYSIEKHHVCDDRNDVEVDLLISLEILDVNPVQSDQLAVSFRDEGTPRTG